MSVRKIRDLKARSWDLLYNSLCLFSFMMSDSERGKLAKEIIKTMDDMLKATEEANKGGST
jgi:hypothetical protein